MAPPLILTTIAEETDPAFAAARQQVLDWLDEHGRAAGVLFEARPFALSAGLDGRPAGGLIGSTKLGWLHVGLLAIAPETRRAGVGRALLAAAEDLARGRGCRGAWLDTYDHQGPDYYPRLGWEMFGELPDFPKGGCRRFYRKAL